MMLRTARTHIHRPRRPWTAGRRAAAAAGILAVALAGTACAARPEPADRRPASATGDAAIEIADLAPTPPTPTLAPTRPATKPTPKPKTEPTVTTRVPQSPSTGGAALADGRYPTLLKHIDPDRGEITVDVVQILHGAAARRAAAAAGDKYAEMYESWILNESSRARVLRVASRGEVTGMFPSEWCHGGERRTTLKGLADNLAKHPSLAQPPIVFWVTVRGGLVRSLHVEEIMLLPAC